MSAKLKASLREDLARSNTKQLRADGFVPSVVYGKEKDPITVAVNNIELQKTIRDEGRNAIISLDVEEGEAVDVMLHEYQVDPIRDTVIHADFYVVDLTQEMDVEVSINLVGEPVGAKEGGVLQQPLYELLVRARPADIPEEITIDISELNIGDAISVADLEGAEGYEVIEDEDTTIVTVTAPEEEEELEPVAEDELVEPELVDQKGESDEDEEVEETE